MVHLNFSYELGKKNYTVFKSINIKQISEKENIQKIPHDLCDLP